MENFKFKVLAAAFLVFAQGAHAYETSLGGISLGQDYGSLRASLMKKYGRPVSTLSRGKIQGDAFQIASGTQLHIRTLKDGKFANWLRISGRRPLKNLDFLGLVNLGQNENGLDRLLGKASFNKLEPDGSRSRHYKGANYSVETKGGAVSSITVFSEPDHPGFDPVREACAVRVPVSKSKNHYGVSAYLEGPSKKPVSSVLALDLTSPDVSLTTELARELGYPEEGDTSSAPGVVFLGPLSVITDGFSRESKAVLGRSVFLAKPMILNFKFGYLCFPKKPLDQAARDLSMLSLPATFDDSGVRVEVRINGQSVSRMRLDPSADSSSLFPRKLERLNLRRANVDHKAILVMLDETAITLGWKPPFFKLQALAEAPSEQVQAIGADVLAGSWMAFDPEKSRIYLGY